MTTVAEAEELATAVDTAEAAARAARTVWRQAAEMTEADCAYALEHGIRAADLPTVLAEVRRQLAAALDASCGCGEQCDCGWRERRDSVR